MWNWHSISLSFLIRLQVAHVTTALGHAYAAVSEAEAETLLWKSKAADAVKIAAAAEAALAAAVAAKAELEVEVLRYQAIAKKAGTRIQAVTYLFICDGFGGSIDVFS